MRIAFVSRLEAHDRLRAPLGVAYVSAAVRQRFPDVCTAWIGGDDADHLFRRVLAVEPDIVGFSSLSLDYGFLRALGERLRAARPGIVEIWGGYHVTMTPEDVPVGAIGVIGEGEFTFTELVATLRRYGPSPDRLSDIPGLVFYDGDRPIRTPPRPAVADLDELPMPDWDIFPPESRPAIISSRGCLFKCGFCSSTNFWGPGLRRHSPARVANELTRLRHRADGAAFILFYDDTFAEQIGWLEALAELVEASGVDLPPLWGHARAALITARMLTVLRRLNVVGLTFGFESGSNRVLRRLKSGAATMGLNFRAALRCRQWGIDPHAHMIVGSPGETVTDVARSLNLIYMTPLGNISVNTALPLPGTEFMRHYEATKGKPSTADFGRMRAEAFVPWIASGMTEGDFVRSKVRMLEQRREASRLLGLQRFHVLIGVAWQGQVAETEAMLAALYANDTGMALHVVVFGVPRTMAKALYRAFPVVVPPESERDPPAWLQQRIIPGIAWAWLPDLGAATPLPDLLQVRLVGFQTYVGDWMTWRLRLEAVNDAFVGWGGRDGTDRDISGTNRYWSNLQEPHDSDL